MHLLNGMSCKLHSDYKLSFPLDILKPYYQIFFHDSYNFYNSLCRFCLFVQFVFLLHMALNNIVWSQPYNSEIAAIL